MVKRDNFFGMIQGDQQGSTSGPGGCLCAMFVAKHSSSPAADQRHCITNAADSLSVDCIGQRCAWRDRTTGAYSYTTP